MIILTSSSTFTPWKRGIESSRPHFKNNCSVLFNLETWKVIAVLISAIIKCGITKSSHINYYLSVYLIYHFIHAFLKLPQKKRNYHFKIKELFNYKQLSFTGAYKAF